MLYVLEWRWVSCFFNIVMKYSTLATAAPRDAATDAEVDLDPMGTSQSVFASRKQSLTKPVTTPLEVEVPERLRPAREFSSFRTMARLGLDLLFAIPPICFLTYAFLVWKNHGQNPGLHPVPALENAAKYGPTIFPIVFAAIIGNLLKAMAAWKLERGIQILSLESLLGSRTVFSTIMTPFSLRNANSVTLGLVILWSLSPLGGQAAFRVLHITPTTYSYPETFSYWEVMRGFPHLGPFSNSGSGALPASLGAFITALSTPANVKQASQDQNGNIKIPMLEAMAKSRQTMQDSDWLELPPDGVYTWSAVAGLPVSGYRTILANYTFVLDTSYMYTNCAISYTTNSNFSEWNKNIHTRKRALKFSNEKTLEIGIGNLHDFKYNPTTPLNLIFTSYTYNAVTNATCSLTTTYVEVEVYCHWDFCKPARVRPSANPRAQSALTVLDGLGPSGKQDFAGPMQSYFLQSLVNATNTPWAYLWSDNPYSTPLEYYFVNPDAPFLPHPTLMRPNPFGWIGADIYPTGDDLFSQRFSQLLNTFYLANTATEAMMGDFKLYIDVNSSINTNHVNVTGIMTPDNLELTYNKTWMAILIIASTVMLFASIAAAVLSALRRGPDVLDRATMFLKDNPYAQVKLLGSMEDGFDQARRSKDVRLCIGDAKDGDDVGYIAVGTLDAVKPMSRVRKSRLYE